MDIAGVVIHVKIIATPRDARVRGIARARQIGEVNQAFRLHLKQRSPFTAQDAALLRKRLGLIGRCASKTETEVARGHSLLLHGHLLRLPDAPARRD